MSIDHPIYDPANLAHLRTTEKWKLTFSVSGSSKLIAWEVSGPEIEVVDHGNGNVEFRVSRPFDSFKVAEIRSGQVFSFGCAGGLVPVFAKVNEQQLVLSNTASELLSTGKVSLNFMALAQQLHGQNYPNDNFFEDLTLLMASMEYCWVNGRLQFGRNLASTRTSYSTEDVFALVESRFEKIAATGRPLIVLVSGGYDSRLNLSFALRLREKYRNEIYCFHELKDANEHRIAEALASTAGLALTTKRRTDFVKPDRSVLLREDIIDAQSGTYRDNLVRWSLYFDWIRRQVPEGIFVGFGAEAHKGKYYQKIVDVRRDAQSVLQFQPILLRSIAESFGRSRVSTHSQDELFRNLISLAESSYEETSGQIDFIHYQTYVAYGYGRRGYFVQKQFGFPMPMLDNEFLAGVFSLPRKEKEGFRLVTELIKRNYPKLHDIPYTSANEKSLEPAKTQMLTSLKRGLIRIGGNRLYSLMGQKREGRTNLAQAEVNFLQEQDPKSEVTKKLKSILLGSGKDMPKIRTEYAMQLFVYLNNLEVRNGITSTFEI